jgi:hypothetical protein
MTAPACMYIGSSFALLPFLMRSFPRTHAFMHPLTHMYPQSPLEESHAQYFFRCPFGKGGSIGKSDGVRFARVDMYIYIYIYIYMGPKFKETNFLLETGCIMHPCTHAPQLFGHAAAATCAGPPDRVNLKATSGMAALERPWPLWSGMAAHCSACTI